jgi:hypothetical protein
MNEQTPQRPQPPGQYGKRREDDCPPPPPPPPPCPDPCGTPPPWGPPKIRPECCPDDRTCCPPDSRGDCTWDEVDDPCVRAASADCGGPWTKVTCTCQSSNPDCPCEEWDCGGYPQGTCVPCKPCDGLIPDDDDPGCDEPPRECCDSDELRRQLDALKRCITSQEGEQERITQQIADRKARRDKLATLIASFDGFIEEYKKERHKLTCREDCLKGFLRETAKVFQDTYRWPSACLDELQTTINGELCALERAKCCLKNLEGKLTKKTKLLWEKEQAQQALDKANAAFKALTGLTAWINGEFLKLEDLKNQIADVLNDADPQKRNYAFFLFYWRFVPGLCRRFPVAICCEPKDDKEPYNTDQSQSQQPAHDHDHGGGHDGSAIHVGCEPGDWHPSQITVGKLRELICCAWDSVYAKEQAVRDTADAVTKVESNRNFMQTKVTDESKPEALEARIKAKVEKVKCTYGASGR